MWLSNLKSLEVARDVDIKTQKAYVGHPHFMFFLFNPIISRIIDNKVEGFDAKLKRCLL